MATQNLRRKEPGRESQEKKKAVLAPLHSFRDAVNIIPSIESISRPSHGRRVLTQAILDFTIVPQSFSSDARRSFHARYYTWFDGAKHAPKTARPSSHLVVSQ